jgi:hypothetical protein
MRQSALTVLTVLGCSCLAIGAAGVDPPPTRPGLWEIRMQHALDGTSVVPPTTMKRCMGASDQARARVTAAEYAKKNCSKNDTREEGSKWVNDLVCKAGAGTMTTHSVTVMTGDTAYHTETTSTFDPPEPGHTRSVTTVDAKWLAAC